ncbi:MAG: MGMT family protein [Treponema sp.]|nr:MGMT family protein [Treponema sp.]
MPAEVTERIIAVLSRVPAGKAASYGTIAAYAGMPTGARQVVRVLHVYAESLGLPWHRVLRKNGAIALPPGGGFELQKALLQAEGIEVSRSGRVDLSRFGWSG